MNGKLRYLMRKNNRKTDIVSYKNELSKIFEAGFHDDDFLGLEESDTIIAGFSDAYKSAPKSISRKYKADEKEGIAKDLKKITHLIEDNMAYLITDKSETCGVCKVDIKKALNRYTEIIELDGDSLRLFALDRKKGVLIDFFEEYDDDVSFLKYELSVWGWSVV